MNIIKNIERSLIVLQWDTVNNPLVIVYTIIWSSERDGLQVATLTEQSSYTITGLTLDTVYTITVNVANTCGSAPEFSTSISFSMDTTYTSSRISPTVTTITNPESFLSTADLSSSIDTILKSSSRTTTATTTESSTTTTNLINIVFSRDINTTTTITAKSSAAATTVTVVFSRDINTSTTTTAAATTTATTAAMINSSTTTTNLVITAVSRSIDTTTKPINIKGITASTNLKVATAISTVISTSIKG